jgi:hypothetical protein
MKLTAYHGATNTIEEIELTGKDKENLEKDIAQLATERKARIDLKKENELAKAAILNRLGLTEEEAQLILGGSN